MATLAAKGHRVLFLENTGVRSIRWSDLPRLRRRLLNWWKGTKGFRQERQNLYVYSPLLLPFPHLRFARWVNRALLGRALQRWSTATSFSRPIVWTFLPTRLAVDLIDSLEPELVVYYCVADFEQLTSHSRAIAKSERMLLDRTDVVFVQGEELRLRFASHSNVHIFPFGVSLSTFSPQVEVAEEIRGLERPIIGYVGGVHRYVDLDLLERVAHEVGGTLVIVGPEQIDAGRLKQLPNVVLTGSLPHTSIPRFVKGFDVGIVPYVDTPYTRSVIPTKMNEYLAMGTPVVATDLPEIRRFVETHGDVVDVAASADAFVDAVRGAVAKRSIIQTQQRISVARTNSWDERIARMSTLVEEALAAHPRAQSRWEDRLQRIYRRARQRLGQIVAGATILYALSFHTPLTWWAAAPLYVADPPRSADAIVVLGGGVGESGVAGGGYQERVERAVELYREGHATQIVFSSGFVFAFQEAEIMKAVAVLQGVPADAIVLETNAVNTLQNITFVHEILAEHGWRRILLVSSPYHMRRALLTLQKQAPDISVIAAPVTRSQFYAHGRGASFQQIRGIVHEYAAIVVYRWRGWL